MLTYADRKRRTLLRLKIRWCLYGSLLVLLAAVLLLRWLPAEWREVLFAAVGSGKRGGEIAERAGWTDLLPLFTALGTVATVMAAIYRSRNAAARLIHERLFDEFHDGVLRPLDRPWPCNGDQPALPWLAADDERAGDERKRVWRELLAWARRTPPVPEPDFSWALLVGRSGAGKSRTAHELARELARQDLLGDPEGRPPGLRQRLQRQRQRASMLFRRALRRSLANDPWDSGYPAHRSRSGSELIQASASYQALFAGWRPRAPTLIVFEDPRAGESAELISWISRRCVPGGTDGVDAPYNFSVRLLVVNQSLPGDLRLLPQPGGGWASQLPHFGGGPWMQSEASYFTVAEWRALTRLRFGPEDRRALGIDGAQFVRLTRSGHPLLTELLLGWLASQSSPQPVDPASLSAIDLLADRAGRVLEALRAAHLDRMDALVVLAAASVCGGLWRTREMKAMDSAALQRVFPDEDVQQRVPPIRPDLIGLAFACLVVETPPEPGVAQPAPHEVQQATASRIASVAWCADPFGTLVALERLGQREFFVGGVRFEKAQSLLQKALLDSSASPAAAPPDELARAYARFCLVHGRPLAALEDRMQAVTPEVAAHIATADLLDQIAVAAVAWRDALRVFALAADRALDAVDKGCAVALLEAWLRLAERYPGGSTDWLEPDYVPRAAFSRLAAALDDALAASPSDRWSEEAGVRAAFETLWASEPCRRTGLQSFALGCAALPIDGPASAFVPLGIVFKAVFDPSGGPAGELQMAMSGADIAALVPGSLMRHAHGWSRLTLHFQQRGDSARAILCAERAEACARQPLSGLTDGDRRQMVVWGAEAWAQAAAAHKVDIDGAISCTLRARGLGDVPAEAAAWASSAAAGQAGRRVDLVDRCTQEAARLVERASALPTAAAASVHVQAAATWRAAAHLHSMLGDPDSAERCAMEVHALHELHAETPLESRLPLAAELAQAWEVVTIADPWTATSVVDAERVVAKIASLVERYAALPLAELTVLINRLAKAWSSVSAVAGDRCEGAAAARSASAITPLFERLRVLSAFDATLCAAAGLMAWSNAAYGHGQSGDGAAAERCAALGDRIYPVSLDWNEAVEGLLFDKRVRAWRYAALGYEKTSDLEGASRCASAAEQHAQLAMHRGVLDRSSTPEDALQAWACVARGRTQSGEHVGAEEAAGRVESWFSALETSEEGVRESCARTVAECWLHLRQGYSHVGDSEAAGRCDAALRALLVRWDAHAEPPPWLDQMRGAMDR